MKTQTWYASKAGNDYQGIVIDEKSGKNIAVAYDVKDTTLLAAAPELLDALEKAYERMLLVAEKTFVTETFILVLDKMENAIDKAKGYN